MELNRNIYIPESYTKCYKKRAIMGEIRIKTSDRTDNLVNQASQQLGLTRAELTRVALMNFLKDMKLE